MRQSGLEPELPPWQGSVLAIRLLSQKLVFSLKKVGPTGLEPVINAL